MNFMVNKKLSFQALPGNEIKKRFNHGGTKSTKKGKRFIPAGGQPFKKVAKYSFWG